MNIDKMSHIIQTSWHWLNSSNDVIKLITIILVLMLYFRFIKPIFKKWIIYLGKKLSPNQYIESFFDNSKMVMLAGILIPLTIINIVLPQLNWTFDSSQYLSNWLNQQVESQIGMWHNQNANVIINQAPIWNTGKLLSNVLYLGNLFYFMIWLWQFLYHTVNFLDKQEKYAQKPLHSFAQIIYFISMIVLAATVYAHYTEQSPLTLFTTLSVMSVAVFMTLKDIILGVISTIIIIISDLVNVGDWITNEKYHADGHVTEISLTTVKVLNFDKTISNIPTYSLITEGFQNQREILKSGLRRLKMAVRIDAQSIKYLKERELEHFQKIQELCDYVEKQSQTRKLTNLDLFRKYIELFLKEHPVVYTPDGKNRNKNSIVDTEPVVHLIEGTKEGVGLEVYCFLKTNDKMTFKHNEAQITGILTKMYASASLFDIKINS